MSRVPDCTLKIPSGCLSRLKGSAWASEHGTHACRTIMAVPCRGRRPRLLGQRALNISANSPAISTQGKPLASFLRQPLFSTSRRMSIPCVVGDDTSWGRDPISPSPALPIVVHRRWALYPTEYIDIYSLNRILRKTRCGVYTWKCAAPYMS